MTATRPALPPTAKTMLGIAAAIVVAKLALALLGGRAATSVFTGTDPGSAGLAIVGALYAMSHLSAVIVAPILALAALVRVGLERLAPGGPATS